MSIRENIARFKDELPDDIILVAVTKTKSPEEIMEAYKTGHRIFGENKVQEMVGKWEVLPEDIQWHMIGHLQRNKVKHMASFVSLVHGVDSLKLLKEIDKQAQKHNRVIDCLLQMHIADESTKFGLNEAELFQMVENDEFHLLKNVNITGLMGMATFTDDLEKVRNEFRYLNEVFQKLKAKLPHIDTLSIGMSGDYRLAIEEGSTMVRIGSSIFGVRNNG